MKPTERPNLIADNGYIVARIKDGVLEVSTRWCQKGCIKGIVIKKGEFIDKPTYYTKKLEG